ncbi:hypothetical protein ACHAW6_000411, partial [Cyclotella cf. meneghiniana]
MRLPICAMGSNGADAGAVAWEARGVAEGRLIIVTMVLVVVAVGRDVAVDTVPEMEVVAGAADAGGLDAGAAAWEVPPITIDRLSNSGCATSTMQPPPLPLLWLTATLCDNENFCRKPLPPPLATSLQPP